ncbi:hypothetical protein STEG23_034064 [Scotinomys teguina]
MVIQERDTDGHTGEGHRWSRDTRPQGFSQPQFASDLLVTSGKAVRHIQTSCDDDDDDDDDDDGDVVVVGSYVV